MWALEGRQAGMGDEVVTGRKWGGSSVTQLVQPHCPHTESGNQRPEVSVAAGGRTVLLI